MPSILQQQFLPDTDAGLLERFSVDGPLAVKAILEDLVRGRALITLYAAHDHEEFVVSQILGWDASGIRFDFTTDEHRRQAILRGAGITVVAFLDSIKIQFDARALRLQPDARLPTLVCTVPTRVFRIQRRDAFRVRPPHRSPVECVIRSVGAEERVYRVMDMSPDGLALMVPATQPVPASGELWQHCRLEIPGYAPIPCDLLVRVVSETLLGDGASARIGCEFHRPTPQTQRAVQIYVMDLQSGRYTPAGQPSKP